MTVELFHFNGQTFTPEEYIVFQQTYPALFVPAPPPLTQVKQQKLQELQAACTRDQQAGVLTSLGIRMAYETKDTLAVDGMVRYAERAQLEKVPLIVSAEGTFYEHRFSTVQGNQLSLEMFEAQLSAYKKLATLSAQVEAADTEEEVAKIQWK